MWYWGPSDSCVLLYLTAHRETAYLPYFELLDTLNQATKSNRVNEDEVLDGRKCIGCKIRQHPHGWILSVQWDSKSNEVQRLGLWTCEGEQDVQWQRLATEVPTNNHKGFRFWI